MAVNQTVKVDFEVNTQPLTKAEQEYKKFNDSLNKGAEKTSSNLNKVEKDFFNIEKQIKNIGPMIAGAFAFERILAFGKAVFDATARQEQFNIALSSMLKSKAQADVLAGQLVNLAVKTPFELTELQDATKRLIAFGFSASEIEGSLLKLGDVASGIGAPIGDLAYLFGTIRTQGKAMTIDINQFANRGIPVWEELAKVTGKSSTELRKFVESGKVGYEEINQVFTNLTTNGGKFQNLMDEQAKSLGGQASNLADKWNIFLTNIGDRAKFIFSGVLKYGVEAIDGLNKLLETDGKKSIEISAAISKARLKIIDEEVEKGALAYENGSQERVDFKIKSYEKELALLKEQSEKEVNEINELNIKKESLNKWLDFKEIEYIDSKIKRRRESNTANVSLEKDLNDKLKQLAEEKIKIDNRFKESKLGAIKDTKNAFAEELRILAIKEQNAQKEADLYEMTAVDKLAIEQDFNQKRIAIYEKYNAILTKTDLETKDGLNLNSAIILDKIEKQADEESKAKIEALRKQWALELEEQNKIEDEKLTRVKNNYEYRNNLILKEEAEALTEVEQMTFASEKEKEQTIFDIQKDYKDLRLRKEIDLIDEKIKLAENDKPKILELEREKADAILELNKNKNSQLEDQDKKSNENKKQQNIVYFQTLLSTIQGFTNLAYENARNQTLLESEELQKRKEQELSNKNLTESEKEVLEAQYRQKELAIKRKQAQADKNKALFDVGINTAVAITNALRDVKTAPITIPLITALGLAQAVAINQRPLPKYFKGTEYVPLNGNAKGQDTIQAMLNEGERVVPTDINAKMRGIKNSDLPYLIELGQMKRKELNFATSQKTIVNIDNKELVNAFKSRPEVSIDINEKGFRKHLINENKRQQIINSRYAV